MQTYITKTGDVWDKIAFETMGSSKHAPLLMRANSKYIHVAIFPKGITLCIPDHPSSDTTTKAPWRRDSV
ncbi:MAG: phage tail protein [Clostridia bacterium]|nr:phage tail protein [Clostridia bacterium]